MDVGAFIILHTFGFVFAFTGRNSNINDFFERIRNDANVMKTFGNVV